MNFRHIALAAALAVAACSSGDEATSGALPKPSTDEAKAFIQARLGDVSASGDSTDAGLRTVGLYTFSPSNLQLGETWSWSFEDTTRFRTTNVETGWSVAAITTVRRGRYTLTPAEIGLPIQAKQDEQTAYIELECAAAACISVEGASESTMEPALPGIEGLQPMESPATKVLWRFNNLDDAQRVAAAATLLLQEAGAQQRSF